MLDYMQKAHRMFSPMRRFPHTFFMFFYFAGAAGGVGGVVPPWLPRGGYTSIVAAKLAKQLALGAAGKIC